MAKLFVVVLCMLICSTAAEQATQGYPKSDYVDRLQRDDGWGKLICILGIGIAPVSGVVYGITRCVIKSGLDALSCIIEDIVITLTATLTVAGVFCALVIGEPEQNGDKIAMAARWFTGKIVEALVSHGSII
jgi:hypothetical protein